MKRKQKQGQMSIDNIKSLLMKGESIEHIAESLDVSTTAMYRLCHIHNIDFRGIRALSRSRKSIELCKEKEAKRIEKIKIRKEKRKKREKEQKEYRKQVEHNRKKRADRINQIAKMRRDGATYSEIAVKYKLTTERVRQILLDYNKSSDIPVPPEDFNHKRPPNPDVTARREKVAELRRTGLSHQEIAKKTKVSIGVIRQDLETYNRDSDNPITPFRVDKRQHIDATAKLDIVKMRNKGASISELAEKYDVCQSRIYQILREASW
ncbi:MAG: hypothetical protein LBK82_15275 [Planctomycetaceae bacterium]|jgi:uncharacterized protein (DUF433 family)|nr:hypothetical protein [Planctomycetaceae bacterium]